MNIFCFLCFLLIIISVFSASASLQDEENEQRRCRRAGNFLSLQKLPPFASKIERKITRLVNTS